MWLVRDRFGVKPLVWGQQAKGDLVFSSSVAAVADCLSAEVDVDYCSFGLRYWAFDSNEQTSPFVGIRSVPPGGWIRARVSDSGLDVKEGRWYDLSKAVALTANSLVELSEDDMLLRCQGILYDAVRLRLRSDVPLAVSLSGGVDSSSVTAIAKLSVRDLHGFTFGSPFEKSSEGPMVERFSQHTGVSPHYIWPKLDSAGIDRLLERTLECQEAPFPSLSVMAQNEIFREVRAAGFKVLLGGQGGDEIFAGYRKFFIVAAWHALKNREGCNALRMALSLGLMLLHEAGAAHTYVQALNRYRPQKKASFKLLNWTSRTANMWGDGISLTDRQIDDVQRWSIPALLRYEDRNSMGHGLETRLPFMDYRLVELALALPVRLKIANGYGKWALRRMTQGLLPDFIRLNRRKRGFDVTASWIDDGLGESLRARINSNRHVLSPHMKSGIQIDRMLSDQALRADSNLLDEALMLAWLCRPVRERGVGEVSA